MPNRNKLRSSWRRQIKRRDLANTITRQGRAPGDRLAMLDDYLNLPRGGRAAWLRRRGLTTQTPVWWAHVYYGKGLRALRADLGLAKQ